MAYTPATILKKWTNDVPDGELYEAYVTKKGYVTSAVGRFSHSSGATTVSVREFLSGSMQDLVADTMGRQVLNEMLEFISGLST
ncbi:hypothetical protein [Marinomonas lutimaris]|uniref:hypothetical protein n=1 Tax=Marinomonas lutimaris TaxID=2846746 RepID=UPI001CA578EA|nr:hypothetical protein [Marinomonas lutimaris]